MDSNQEIEDHHNDPVVTSLRKKFENLSFLSSERCIYRVPKRLREQNEKAYTPQIISIGPLHHGSQSLQAMEEHKSRYLLHFLGRYGLSLDDSVVFTRNLEEQVRNCYADSINLGSDEFVEMVLVDGAFIVEAFLRKRFPELQDANDYIFHRPWMLNDVCRDMILLENQLPFFVLEGLFNLAYPAPVRGFPSLLQLTHYFLNLFFVPWDTKNIPLTISSCEIKHLTDFLRVSQLPSLPDLSKSTGSVNSNIVGNITTGLIPSVTKLHEAGVKFKMSSSKCLLDIRFTKGELEIPKVKVEDDSESFFRNLLAFEVCHCDSNHETYVTYYIDLMDGLIDTPADVDLLVHSGIIDNCIGDSIKVSTLFNNLLWEVNVGTSCYGDLCRDLNRYRMVRWHKWKAILKREYLGTPWLIAPIIAAAILLILTLLQTIFSGLSL